jgi:protein gp37
LANRLKAMGNPRYQADGDPKTSGAGFGVTLHPDKLDDPCHWRAPRRVFVNSMSDLFHPAVPQEFISQVFDVMRRCPQHTFQVLTKRPQRMKEWAIAHSWHGCTEHGGNVWLGTSIESDRYSFRANHLRATPAAVRFLSLEPLLGPLPSLDLSAMDWVIVGGESGTGARPMHPDWARDLRDRCQEAGVPFFFKQWGEWSPGTVRTPQASSATNHGHFCADGKFITRSDDRDSRVFIARNGRKVSGRELDGRTWDEYPKEAERPEIKHVQGLATTEIEVEV